MKSIERKLVIINLYLLLLVLIHSSVDASVDYCAIEEKHCATYVGHTRIRVPHIGCNETGITFRVNPKCTNIKVVKLKNRTKNYILELHNELRDKLAAGNVDKYPPASRMLEMYWDAELEATACLHAQYCVMEHDKCRATPSYDHPGQNLRLASYTVRPQTNITKEWLNGILSFFNEYADVDSSIIDNYVHHQPGQKMYGHFTVMSKDSNDRIGCCHITYENNSNFGEVVYGHLLTCNYRKTNGGRTYVKGEPVTQCQDFGLDYKRSSRYKHMCANPIDHPKLILKNEEKKDDELPKDYCELAKLKCGRNKHVGCKTDSGFTVNPSCKNIQVHGMTSHYKDLLLKEHNVYRDSVAGGEYNNFPAASKMLEMKWDSSLEEIACAHVQYCELHHAKCLATNRDNIPGQTLYAILHSAPGKNHSEIFRIAVQAWFNQSFAAPPRIIDNYSSHFGDFALMIKEDQNKLGCCFITHEEYKNDINWHGHMITCLYEHVTFVNSQLYSRGKPASKCKEYGDEYATSATYENLCTNKNSAGLVEMNILTLMSVVFISLYA